MAQILPIILNDGTADVTYSPYEVDASGVARLRTASDTVIGTSELSVSGRTATANRRVVVKLQIPTVQNEIVNGITIPKVVRMEIGKIELSLPITSTKAERTSIRNQLADALKNVLVAAVIDNNENLY